ncbi:MAG: hypothetical protein JXA96_17670 [Sedimentisphaerales bacterium]|nr:hypothetical protein [Sedimentisphaerales bacterium]
MKIRTLINLSLILVSMALINGCGSKKYADVEKATNDYTKAMENMAASIEKATNASDVAKAINNYNDKMEILTPKMKKISEKYPELKDKNNIPEELKECQKRAEEAAQKFTSSMMKAMPYMNDPEVQKAQQRMGEVMMN